MKAAKNFSYGDGEKNHVFEVGDEVPDKVVKALGDSADTLILERAAKANPDSLSRAQLMELAGISQEDAEVLGADPDEGDEFNEEAFREGMSNFNSKADLVEWAETILNIEGLSAKDNRAKIEDDIVSAMTSPEEGDDEGDDEG